MSKNLQQATRNRAEIAEIKRKYLSGEISRDTAEQSAQPILDRVNARAAEIAKKHSQRPYKISFSEAMRNNY